MANANDPQVPTTLNIPSIVAFAVISFFAIRYFFFSAPASSTAPGAAGNGARNGRRVDFARIDAVTQMFPQMSRRDVEWDLLRNGGSVQATTDKILRDGRLETPPPNFQAQAPPTPIVGAAGSASSRRNGGSGQVEAKTTHPDLITRYKLTSRLGESSASTQERSNTTSSTEKGRTKNSWSGNKTERQSLLQKRREDMILAARRKLEERDRQAQ